MKLTNKDFKISKSTKRMLCSLVDSKERHHWKKMMIDAEIAERKAKTSKIKERNLNQGDE